MSIASPLFNCQQATLLVERRADETLPFPTRIQLWAHLHLCPRCRRYEVQSQFIARHAQRAASPAATLPADACARLQLLLSRPAGLPPVSAGGATEESSI